MSETLKSMFTVFLTGFVLFIIFMITSQFVGFHVVTILAMCILISQFICKEI